MDNIIRLFTQTDVWEVIDFMLVPTIFVLKILNHKLQVHANMCNENKEIKKLKKK